MIGSFASRLGFAVVLAALAAGCGGLGGSAVVPHPVSGLGSQQARPIRTVGLGPEVFSKLGGGIFGWDIDQNGDDGLLSETVLGKTPFVNAIETFDEKTGRITRVVRKWTSNGEGPLPYVEAIAGSDIGFVDGQRYFVKNSRIIRDDEFYAINPVTGEKIDGSWSPGDVERLLPDFMTENETSPHQIFMAYRQNLHNGTDQPLLYPYDASSNTFGKAFAFPRRQVMAGYLLYAAVDTKRDLGLTGYSPAPYNQDHPLWFDVFDARTGALERSFRGHGIGFVNGMAIDSTTDVMCTTSADTGVAFTNVVTGKGFEVELPMLYGGGPLTGGAAVAVDSLHHLFLIAQLNSTYSPTGGSTVYVFDEYGKLVEGINGFNFLNTASAVVVHIAVNPAERIGFVPAQQSNALQSFTY